MNGHSSVSIDPTQEVRLSVEQLQPVLEKMLIKKSMFQFDAATVVIRILEADLYGFPAEGCGQIGNILDAIDVGDVDPRGRVLTLEDAPAYAVLDGSRAVGQVAATKGAEMAITKARESGLAIVAVGNSQRLGAAGVYARLMAAQGLIGICTSSTGGPTVAAPGTTVGAVGNTPFAYAVPVDSSHPLVFDSACGHHSWEKLKLLSRYGFPFPGETAFDASGSEAHDLATAQVLQPAGGRLGFGLSLLCSILAGPLAGGRLPIHKKRSPSAEDSQHLFLAIDISRFADPAKFQQELQSSLDEMRQLPSSPESVRIPGNRQAACFQDFSEQGIPVHHSVAEELRQRAEKLKIEVTW